MTYGFDKDFWERHWLTGTRRGPGSMGGNPPNPYLARETSGLTPGTALDAGCGGGAEAIWLASHGWHVTAADISPAALARAAERAAASGTPERLRWVEADLSVWSPDARFDLVMTHYAHPAMPQLEFYDRIAGWVAPGGTLLIVGHLHTPDSHRPWAPPSRRGVGHLRGHHGAPGRHGVGDRHRRRAPPHAHRPRGPSGPPPGCRRARHPAPVTAPSHEAPERGRTAPVTLLSLLVGVTAASPPASPAGGRAHRRPIDDGLSDLPGWRGAGPHGHLRLRRRRLPLNPPRHARHGIRYGSGDDALHRGRHRGAHAGRRDEHSAWINKLAGMTLLDLNSDQLLSTTRAVRKRLDFTRAGARRADPRMCGDGVAGAVRIEHGDHAVRRGPGRGETTRDR